MRFTCRARPSCARKVLQAALSVVVILLACESFLVSCKRSGHQPGHQTTILYVLLGNPEFQHWTMVGIQQARLWNPEVDIVLVHTKELLDASEWRQHLSSMQVRLLQYEDILDTFSMDFAEKYRILVAQLGIALNPRFGSNGNADFMQLTMIRLAAVHRAMQVMGLRRVVHLENDQMLYAPVRLLSGAAEQCGLRLGMTRLGNKKLTPAVLYIHTADDLYDLLVYMDGVFASGAENAKRVTGTEWVSDMTLTAVFFNEHELQSQLHRHLQRPVGTLPNHADQSCLFLKSGHIFDAAALGQWCCGTFFQPEKHFYEKSEDSNIAYWDGDFTWVNDSSTSFHRKPLWNGKPIFNLHMHSKQLQMWAS